VSREQELGTEGLGTEGLRASAFFRVFCGLVVFAIFAVVTGGAIVGGIADAEFGGELISIAGKGDGFDGSEGEDVLFALDVLRGDLESIEEVSGALGVEPFGVEIVDDLGEGDQDGAAVFEDGNLAGFCSRGIRLGGGGGWFGRAVEAGVEVAIVLVAEGGGVAPGSVRHDVAAFEVHSRSLLGIARKKNSGLFAEVRSLQ
jgi:hypothetical protein